jgi:hypothetical protein
MLYVFGGTGYTGKERGRGSAAVDGAGCVGRRPAACTCRTAAVSLSLAEGARVGREEMCRHMCTFAVGRICTAAKRAGHQTFCIGKRDRATPLLIMAKCIYMLSVCMKYLPVLAFYSETRTMPHGAAEHVSQMACAMLKHRYNKDRMFLSLNTTSRYWLSLSLSLSIYIYIYIYI